jgi:hypothetical protein
MTKQQAHELKLKIAVFAESTAMLEYAKSKGQATLDCALAERDRARKELYSFIDEMVTEE